MKTSSDRKRLQERYFGEEAFHSLPWLRVTVSRQKVAGEQNQDGGHHQKSPGLNTGKSLYQDVALHNSNGHSSCGVQWA